MFHILLIPAVKITLFMMIIRHSFEKIGYFLNGIVTLRYTMYQQKMCIHARQKTVAKLIKILIFFVMATADIKP